MNNSLTPKGKTHEALSPLSVSLYQSKYTKTQLFDSFS